jgi:hypothetical protein
MESLLFTADVLLFVSWEREEARDRAEANLLYVEATGLPIKYH